MPRLTIGLPVYNGEAFLREAIDSLLGQTYTDFELVISDNASTDSTAEICKEYVSRDSRVRYFRHDANCGAAKNYNGIFERCATELFKWAAHDDVCAPTFLARCVEALDRKKDAVLAFTQAMIIDGQGRRIDAGSGYDPSITLSSPDVRRRFHELVCTRHRCFAIFGVLRSSALRATTLLRSYSHSDRLLLGQLILDGPCAHIAEPLFFSRVHAEASGQLFSQPAALLTWWDPAKRGRFLFPHWRVWAEYLRIVQRSSVRTSERLSLYSEVFRSFETRWWRRKLVEDLKRPIAMTLARSAHGR
jgi:glycosyltransferase involved in cell wall biosynthesis